MSQISGNLSLEALRAANVERQAAWCPHPSQQPDLGYRGNELAGETGEACNAIKKLERERHGWAGSRDTLEHLAEELADVVICADLCAITAGVDLASAVIAKFNATSEKVGLPHRLSATAVSPQSETPEQFHARQIAEEIEEGSGFWKACSGCQESVDGYVSERDYPYNRVFQCQPGGGCSECGGLGVLWDNIDYDAMARDILADEDEPLNSQDDDADRCDVCLVAFKPDDICATDIELGIAHAACLDGSPVVDLQTGAPLPEGKPILIYRYDSLSEPGDAKA